MYNKYLHSAFLRSLIVSEHPVIIAHISLIDIRYLMGRIQLLDNVIVNRFQKKLFSLREHTVKHGLDFNSLSKLFEDPNNSHIL